MKPWQIFLLVHLAVLFLNVFPSEAKIVRYDLTVHYKPVNFTGKEVLAMALNDSIPGPTLRFREGDVAQIRFRNGMDVPTSVHWHGILLPHRQDGVPFVANRPIQPGETKVFEFPLIQSGTYWFHSHTGLQEQRGVYGAIVITPKSGERLRVDRDEVVVLSDWTDEDPDRILRTLKSGNDYYSMKKNTLQNLQGALRRGALTNALKRSLGRMPPMDISDVAYDRFLANGQPETTIPAAPGERVRLRFVNASTATYFHLQFAGGPVLIVAADGQEVQPVAVDRFLMAIAETYDVLITVPENGAYEFRATAQDGSGHTSVFIGRGKRVLAPDVPKPNLYQMGMSMKRMKTNKAMAHGGAKMGHARPPAPYPRLRSLKPTALPTGNPVREIVLTLTGDMERYVWSMDGRVIAEDNVIHIRHGENIRFVLVNKTMMHHPMHLHGHFFRVVNGQGMYSPLKHTVDVPPGATQIIEFEGTEFYDWFFHCHVLYHAKSGMARVVSYEDKTIGADLQAIRPQLYKDPWYGWINGTLQSHMSDGIAVVSNSRNIFSINWEVGWQEVNSTEHDVELTYDRYFNRFLTAFVGGNLSAEDDQGMVGLRLLLPLNIASQWRLDTEGDFRFTLGQSLQLTRRWGIFGSFEYDTETKEEWVAGANYILSKNFSLVGQYHSDFGGGVGLRFRY